MIGILAAMEEEVTAIKDIMKVEKEEIYQNVNFIYGTIYGKEIVLCKCGVGKCLASMTATLLCSKEKLDSLINVGVAGGLKEDQRVADTVVSDYVLQADFDTSPIDGPEGVGLRFTADKALLDKFRQASDNLGIRYHVGTIASQDIFMAREEDFKSLMEKFPESACSEMEGGAIAQIAQVFNVPFIVVRSLSDVVHHNDNPMEFETYAKLASKQAAKLIEEMMSLS